MYPQVFGKYVLERELARGGMARVLLATLRGAGGFEKRLVVKQIRDELAMDEDFVRRFVEEAKTTVALSHPNIVPVYELGVERGTYFLAMELVEGVSVSELLREDNKKRKLTPEEGAFVGVAICRALDYAHRRMQVVHRDITPRNVMIDEEGQIKLIDFGIAARAAAPSEDKNRAEKDRRVFGSPGHMPPEQIAGKQLGPATDLFAVAVLLMEAWSGHAPFRRKTAEESEEAMRAPHPKPSDTDIRLLPLDEPIARAMSLDPAARQQDADELGRALRKFLQEVDLGDVARGLGDRARHVREQNTAREERSTKPELESAPARDGESGTETFAARDEIKKLSEAPPAVEIGTRRLAFLTPAIPIKKEDLPEVEIRVETIATAPIETPVRLAESKRPSKIGTSRVVMAGAVILLSGAVVYQATRNDATPSKNAQGPITGAASVSSPSTVASAIASTAAPTAATTTTTTTSSATAPSASSGNVAPQNDARLSLFGDPGTRISIDGNSHGACPARDISVSSGVHEIRFTFDPTGESRIQQVRLAAGGHATLRADFTGPTPVVHVEH